MSLHVGDQLGLYQILAPLGAGGMGGVYKARDTRLDRSVAIKVLPEYNAHRTDARARFECETRAVASLNQTEHRYPPLEKGALPLDQALICTIQIGEALDRAHRAGVTHRDVKPQNIVLTRDGVKVLAFGLAKWTAKTGLSDETLTKVLTAEGMDGSASCHLNFCRCRVLEWITLEAL